jgi:DNA-binding transcriptional ArsR family regulator
MDEDSLREDALACGTRRDILKLLSERSMRPADLSRALAKDTSTISEHLKALARAGYIESVKRDGHKWVFYRLTRASYGMFPDKRRNFVFMLMSFISLSLACAGMLLYLTGGPQQGAVAAGFAQSGAEMETSGQGAMPAPFAVRSLATANDAAAEIGTSSNDATVNLSNNEPDLMNAKSAAPATLGSESAQKEDALPVRDDKLLYASLAFGVLGAIMMIQQAYRMGVDSRTT